MCRKRLFSLFVVAFGLFWGVNSAVAQEEPKPENVAAEAHAEGHEEKKGINVTELVFGHVSDSHEWHLFGFKGADGKEKAVAIPLPMIIYQPGLGLKVMSSSHFEEWHEQDGKQISNEHEGLYIEKYMKEKVMAVDGSKVYDFSITKNVMSMLIGVVLLLWLVTSAAKKYNSGSMKAPKGFQNALEVCIIFLRDEVAKPNIGQKQYKKFMPLLLTIFFFIWINNLLGLLPGGANFTGNIAVTLCLAVVSFIVMVTKANKHFWGHLLNPPGVPFGVKCLLVPIEIISLFIKPIALTIRLFANILAGHIVILCVISLIFIFGAISKGVGVGFIPVSLAFSLFMFFLELLVAAIQAFIFTNLTAVFVGQAVEETHHHSDADHVHGDHMVPENEIIL